MQDRLDERCRVTPFHLGIGTTIDGIPKQCIEEAVQIFGSNLMNAKIKKCTFQFQFSPSQNSCTENFSLTKCLIQCNAMNGMPHITSKVLWMSKKDNRSTSLQSSVARVDIRNGSNEWRMRDRFGAIALLGLNLRRKSARSEPTKHMRSLCGLNIFYKKEEKDTSKCQKNWFLY